MNTALPVSHAVPLDHLSSWVETCKISDTQAAALRHKLAKHKINTPAIMRRVSRERWVQIFRACDLMEGDLIGLEDILFPDGRTFPLGPDLCSFDKPFEHNDCSGNNTKSMSAGAGTDGVPTENKGKGGRQVPAAEELKKARTTPTDLANYNLPANIYNFDLAACENHKEETKFVKLIIREVTM